MIMKRNWCNFVDLLRQRAEETPDQKIYTFLANGEQETAHLTCQELDRKARAIAGFLQVFQARGERILLLYPPGLEYISAFFGCLYAGAIAVPAYPPRNRRHFPRIRTIVNDAQAKFLLTVGKFQKSIESCLKEHSVPASLEIIITDQMPAEEHPWCAPVIKGDSLAFLQYTSGSTALPKGVMVSHANLLDNSAMICERFKTTSNSRGVIWLPPYHDMGLIGGILQPLYIGCPVVLMSPAAFLQRPLRWLEAISNFRATSSGGPNFAYQLCVEKITPEKVQSLDLHSWDLAFCGAEPVHPNTLERFIAMFAPSGFRREAFYPCYGLAEATLFVSGGQKSKPPVIGHFQTKAIEKNKVLPVSKDKTKEQTLVGVGKTFSKQRILIVNPKSQTQCVADEIGEVWVSGPGIAQGYWNREKETQHSFQAFIKDTGEGPFLRTGDLGFLREGELFITGRLKDLIIIRGRNHYPQDIEWTVENCHKTIRRNCCAAFSISVDDQERLVIVAEVERRYQQSLQSLKEAGTLEQNYRLCNDCDQSTATGHGSTTTSQTLNIDTVIAQIRKAVVENHELQINHIVLIPFGTIPRTSSGKIQRHACKVSFLENSLDTIVQWQITESVPTMPTTSTHVERLTITGEWEHFLARYWADALDIDRMDIHSLSNFFQLGGDSLNAITLTGTLADMIGQELDPDLLYQYPILQGLANYLKREFKSPPTENRKQDIHPQYQKFCRPDTLEYPLLPLQQSFLVGRSLGDTAIYMMLDLELHGDLNPTFFQQAIDLLNGRHPALRSAFTIKSKGLSQYTIQNEHNINVVYYDSFTQFSEEEREKRLNHESELLVQQSFDNLKGETFRAKLFCTDSQTYRLLVHFDHLAIDGFSLSKWFKDLHFVYNQLLQGQTVANVPQTSISFKDYVEILTAVENSEQRSTDMTYWLDTIPKYETFPAIGEPEQLDDLQGFYVHNQVMDIELVRQLQEHAQSYKLTFFSILMAAFFKLLAIRTNSQTLTINTPYLNRRPYARDIQDVLGCFTDILPVRCDRLLEQDLPGLARKIHQTLAEMHRHSSVSGVEIARAVARNQKITPKALSPVIFSSALFPLEEMSSPDTYTFSSVRIRTGAPETILDVIVYQACGEFVCSWNYSQSDFAVETIHSLAKQYAHILREFVQQPKNTDSFNIFDTVGFTPQRKIPNEWNATTVDYPLKKCVHELVEDQVCRTPHAPALIFEDKQLTFQKLNAKANRFAHYLRGHGIGPESLVGIAMERSFDMVIGLLGILKAGGAYVPLDPEYPPERLAFMLKDSQVPVLVTQKKFIAGLPTHQAQLICLDRDWPLIAQQPDTIPCRNTSSENVIYGIYTSGSTGKPKAALNLHRALVNRLLWMQDLYNLNPKDKVLQKTPFSFDVSGWEFWWSLITGAQMVIAKPGGHKDSAYLVRLVQEKQVTTIHFVPPMLQLFLQEQGVELCSSLRRVICSGEVLPYRLEQRFFEKFTKCELHNLYGPTEAAIDVTHWQCQPDDVRRNVPIGRPIANTQIYILDRDMQPVPVGSAGELYIGGVNLARGYLNRFELTQEKFIPNPFSKDLNSRLYKTGDLARYLPDGNIEYLGRLDHQVKIRGFRIELGEIEANLDRHPEIRQSVVLAKEDHNGDKRLVAYLVPDKQSHCDLDGIREFLKRKLPDYMIPVVFLVIDAFPLTPNGKVDRHALPEPEQQRSQSSTSFVGPQNEIQRQIAKIWQDMLSINTIGIHDNFFELGGHSLLAIRMHRKLQELFDLDISVVEIFQYPTIHSMADYISQHHHNLPAESKQARGKRRIVRRTAVNQQRKRRQQHRKIQRINDNPEIEKERTHG